MLHTQREQQYVQPAAADTQQSMGTGRQAAGGETSVRARHRREAAAPAGMELDA